VYCLLRRSRHRKQNHRKETYQLHFGHLKYPIPGASWVTFFQTWRGICVRRLPMKESPIRRSSPQRAPVVPRIMKQLIIVNCLLQHSVRAPTSCDTLYLWSTYNLPSVSCFTLFNRALKDSLSQRFIDMRLKIRFRQHHCKFQKFGLLPKYTRLQYNFVLHEFVLGFTRKTSLLTIEKGYSVRKIDTTSTHHKFL
jgi:hypothetical protein